MNTYPFAPKVRGRRLPCGHRSARVSKDDALALRSGLAITRRCGICKGRWIGTAMKHPEISAKTATDIAVITWEEVQ